MKLKLNKKSSKDNVAQLMRRAGYNFIRSVAGGEEMSFQRALEYGGWPRFHVYVKDEGDFLVINLHLDQKRPSYAGSAAHNAEYDSELTRAEMERIKALT